METQKGIKFRQVAVGFAPILAGIVLLAGMVTASWEGAAADRTTAYYTALAAHPLRAQVSTILIGFGWLLYVPALLGMAQLTRHRATRLGNAGWALGTIGFGLMAGMTAVIDVYDTVLAQELGVERAVAISAVMDSLPTVAVVGIIAGPGALVGMLLMAAALWRSGEVPVWGPAALAVGTVAFVLSPPALIPMTFVASALLVGGIPVALRILRATDWEPGGPIRPHATGPVAGVPVPVEARVIDG